MKYALVPNILPPSDRDDMRSIFAPMIPVAQPWCLLEPARSFVSVARLHQVLSARFGCQFTGDRGPGHQYWQTPDGARFPVKDPQAVVGSMEVHRADGSRQFCYSFEYVAKLIEQVAALIRMGGRVSRPARCH